MKYQRLILWAFVLYLAFCIASGDVGARVVAPVPATIATPCHSYYATAHTGDFDLSVCREDDNQAIDEAVALVVRISGDSRYVEYVSVVYIP